MALSAGQLLWSTAQLGLVTVFVGGAPRHLTLDPVLAMLALGVLGTGAAYILNYAVVRLAGATTASTVTYLVPVVATALGIAVLGEHLVWNQPVGAAVVLASVAFSEGLTARRRAPVVARR
jgi:drug/metabolite transporter (DMT)-like permease